MQEKYPIITKSLMTATIFESTVFVQSKDREKNIHQQWVSIIIVNHNNGNELMRCLKSIEDEDYPQYEVIVVDNNSDDGSLFPIEDKFPWVKIVKSSINGGYGYGNNLGSREALGDILVFLNPDTEVSNGWIGTLVSYFHEYPQAGLITSRIVYMNNDQVINSAGNQIHVTGLSFCRGLGEPVNKYLDTEWNVSASGAGFAVKKEVFEDIRGFDPNLFLYHDDVDFSLRSRLAGYTCLYTPAWIVKHQSEFRLTPEKWFWVEQNRLAVLLKVYKWRTLFFLFPCILLVELLTWAHLLSRGVNYVKAKAGSYSWVIKHLNEILSSREHIQENRRISDNQLLRTLSLEVPFHQILKGFPATSSEFIINNFFKAMFWLAIKFIE